MSLTNLRKSFNYNPEAAAKHLTTINNRRHKCAVGDPSLNVPLHFNISMKWPECADMFEEIHDQGGCSVGGAIAAVDTIADRQCIAYGSRQKRVSAWDLAECCELCDYYIPGDVCSNFINTYYDFDQYVANGFVTEDCKPYPFAPGTVNSTGGDTCTQSCQPSYTDKTYEEDKQYAQAVVRFGISDDLLRAEIASRGSMITSMAIYASFLSYSEGVYRIRFADIMNGDQYVGFQDVRIVGWGPNYWIAANSWGENGFFRIDSTDPEYATSFAGGSWGPVFKKN